jgi:hypothetical protein
MNVLSLTKAQEAPVFGPQKNISSKIWHLLRRGAAGDARLYRLLDELDVLRRAVDANIGGKPVRLEHLALAVLVAMEKLAPKGELLARVLGRRVRSLRGVWRAHYTPKLKKRTALLRRLKDVFRRHQSQPVDRVVKLIDPVLRGWVNYFAAS